MFSLKRDYLHWKFFYCVPCAPAVSQRVRFNHPGRGWRSTKVPSNHRPGWRPSRWLLYPTTLLLLSGVGITAYENNQPFRHSILAAVRCSRVAGGFFCLCCCWSHSLQIGAAVLGAIDYKRTFAANYESDDERLKAFPGVRKESWRHSWRMGVCLFIGLVAVVCWYSNIARRIHQNGTTYGFIVSQVRHSSSIVSTSWPEARVVLPKEWTSTMVDVDMASSFAITDCHLIYFRGLCKTSASQLLTRTSRDCSWRIWVRVYLMHLKILIHSLSGLRAWHKFT